MKKLISLLSILFLLTLFIPYHHAEAARGSGGFHGSGGHGGFRGDGGHGGFRGDVGHGGFRGFRGHEGFRGHGGFFPGLIIGGALGWGLWPYYYPPDYYYYPPPPYYYPPPEYYYPPTDQSGQVPPSASRGRVEGCSSIPAKARVKRKRLKILTSATAGLLVRQALIRQNHPLAPLMRRPSKRAATIFGRSAPALMPTGIL